MIYGKVDRPPRGACAYSIVHVLSAGARGRNKQSLNGWHCLQSKRGVTTHARSQHQLPVAGVLWPFGRFLGRQTGSGLRGGPECPDTRGPSGRHAGSADPFNRKARIRGRSRICEPRGRCVELRQSVRIRTSRRGPGRLRRCGGGPCDRGCRAVCLGRRQAVSRLLCFLPSRPEQSKTLYEAALSRRR